MLKKSLRVGSIVLLLLSLIFFMGCSNGSTDPEEEEDDTGGNGEVVVPPEEDPKVRSVKILPGDIELGRGENTTFTVDVAADPGADKTVAWAIVDPEAGEPSVKNTKITQRGKLTLDTGLIIGQEIYVKATAGGVSDEVKVTVAPEGPYFTWEPGTYKVPANNAVAVPEGTIYGYLRGYSHAEKDIRLRVGVLEEGVDYTIATDNGVSGARPDNNGDVIKVIGTTTPYEGITVTVNSSRITLEDPTLTGIIQITMLPHAFFGNDSAELNPGRTSLILEVVDKGAIDELTNLDVNFDTDNRPLQGRSAKTGIHDESTNMVFTGTDVDKFSLLSIKWNYLSIAGNFSKQAEPLVGSVTLRANDGSYFLKDFDAEAIFSGTSFRKGSPEVSNITVSLDGKTLAFDLTYDIFAVILMVDDAIPAKVGIANIDPDDAIYDFGFKPLFTTAPAHTDPQPVLRFTENNYFDAALVWSGDGVVAATDKAPGAFKTGKAPDLLNATATITLTPKPGYTFEGSDLEFENFVISQGGVPGNDSGIFVAGSPTGTLTKGTEDGSLVLKLNYQVQEKVILKSEFKPTNFEALIARPIHGKSVGVTGDFKDKPESPYTASVVWTPVTNAAARSGIFAIDITDPVATVTLTPKPGYAFKVSPSPDYGFTDTQFSSLVAIDAPEATGNYGTTYTSYEITGSITYDIDDDDILQQITSLDGVVITGVDPVAEGIDFSGPVTLSSNISPFAVSSTIVGQSGLTMVYGTPLRLRFTLEKEDGYTFQATDGPLSYFAVDDPTDMTGAMTKAEKKAYIEKFLGRGIYYGTVIAEEDGVHLNDLFINASDALVLDVSYTVKPKPIMASDITVAEVGNTATTLPGTAGPVPVFSATNPPEYTTAYALKKENASGAYEDFTANTLAIGEYKVIITITPKDGHTFVGSSDLNTIVTSTLPGIYGSGGSATNLISPDTTVESFIIETTGETAEKVKAKDKLTVTVPFTVS